MNSPFHPRRIRPLLAVLGAMTLFVSGCAPKLQDAIVATVGDQKITVGDFEQQYLKSNTSPAQGKDIGMEERERFLDLLVKYRLKVADAYRQGLDKSEPVMSEIDQYKGSLAASFLTDREVVRPGIERLYDRRREEIRASHILLELKPNASPADSATAYRKAYEIIAEASRGTDFGQLALSFSTDPSVQSNKGDLYYFSAGQMVPAFEDGVYDLKPGEISPDPIRTQYGLHVVKVTDRQAASGEIRCAHIMVRFPSQKPTAEDTAAAYKKITALMDSLTAGADFAGLAERQSEDPGSAPREGDLGWFSRRRWIQPFDEAAFKLSPGQMSGIVRTAYGYHIIKCLEARPPKSFEESKQDLTQLYQQVRYQEEYARYLAGLKREVGFSGNDSVMHAMFSSLDSTRTTRDSGWSATIPPDLGRATILRVAGSSISVDSVISLIRLRQDLSNIPLRTTQLTTALDRVSENLVFAAKADRLKQQNPEFAALLHEYAEAILLYQVEQENVWTRVEAGDSVLQAYFAANRDRYTWPDRVRFTELRAGNETNARILVEQIRDGMTLEQVAAADSVRMQRPTRFQITFREGGGSLQNSSRRTLDSVFTELRADTLLRVVVTIHPDTSTRSARALTLSSRRLNALRKRMEEAAGIAPARIVETTRPHTGTPGASSNVVQLDVTGKQPRVVGKPVLSLLSTENDERALRADSLTVGQVSHPFFFKAGWSIVRLDGREPARRKTYDEAAPEVATAYQDYESKRLEAQWLDRLRARFPVTIHRDQLARAFSEQR